jgi:dihydropyrimidinase
MTRRYDTVVRGGRIATAADDYLADLGIRDGRIVTIGAIAASQGEEVIDAEGKLVIPGGIDSHCHMDQQPIDGVETADDFFTATRAAACGGTTTVIPFAMPLPGQSLADVARDYRRRGDGKAAVDFGIHLIVIDPNPQFLGQELPAFVAEGITSLKIYMTYEGFRLVDRQCLDVLKAARREGALVMVHAENDDMIEWLTEELIAEGKTALRHFGDAHAPIAEREAASRAIALSELARHPILIVHVSTEAAVAEIERARMRGADILAETCPQYLLLDEGHLSTHGIEAAKYICSPPPRAKGEAEKLWRALRRGAFNVFSSDHSPRIFASARGKMRHGGDAHFHQVSAGMPGIECRLPLLFSEGVNKGRITIQQFVALSATNAARIYGLSPRKGSIAIGADADLAIWDPHKRVTIRHSILNDATDYTPYEGMEIAGWPVATLLRGRIVAREHRFLGAAGQGRYQQRARFTP